MKNNDFLTGFSTMISIKNRVAIDEFCAKKSISKRVFVEQALKLFEETGFNFDEIETATTQKHEEIIRQCANKNNFFKAADVYNFYIKKGKSPATAAQYSNRKIENNPIYTLQKKGKVVPFLSGFLYDNFNSPVDFLEVISDYEDKQFVDKLILKASKLYGEANMKECASILFKLYGESK